MRKKYYADLFMSVREIEDDSKIRNGDVDTFELDEERAFDFALQKLGYNGRICRNVEVSPGTFMKEVF